MVAGAREAMRRDPRLAIQDGEILCLVCGRALRQLTNTHLRSHGLTPEAYREAFGYNRGTALMARTLRAFYRDRAVRIRLATQIRGNPLRGDPGFFAEWARRTIRLEERLNRREVGRRAARLREARFREVGPHPYTKPVDLALLHSLRLAGLTLRQIACHLGVSPTTISARLRLAFPGRDMTGRKPWPHRQPGPGAHGRDARDGAEVARRSGGNGRPSPSAAAPPDGVAASEYRGRVAVMTIQGDL